MESATPEGAGLRKKRKEEGRNEKRKRIEESGGRRPRSSNGGAAQGGRSSQENVKRKNKMGNTGHRFGRVMDTVPCRNKPRYWTLSIALPGSVVSNCQTRELRTMLVGQIARAATIYHVDEIIVFDDKLSKNPTNNRSYGRRPRTREGTGDEKQESSPSDSGRRSDPHTFMARVLQYCECPQYLRRNFFPMHVDLQFTGLLAPTDAPHHVRAEDHSKFREGVVMDKSGPNSGSFVNCGIRNRPVEIDARLTPGIRCTVKLDPLSYKSPGPMTGHVVAPSTPREDDGTYWGYTTRLASSIKAVFDECPWEDGYDLKIGTSERGSHDLDGGSGLNLPRFKRALIVFGGVAGIEECVDADESMSLPGSQSHQLFDLWVNICPFQGSRTIRTEEAVLIGLAKFSPLLASNGQQVNARPETTKVVTETVNFTDEEPSDESSDEE